jgi:hypothetical protein
VDACNLTHLPEPNDIHSLKMRMEAFKRLLQTAWGRDKGLMVATVAAEYLHEDSRVMLGKLPSPFGQVPPRLGLHPDCPRPQHGVPVRRPRSSHILAHTHFYATLHEAPVEFLAEVFESLTLRDLSFWFPDQSGTVSQLPETWTLAQAADRVGSCPLLLHGPQNLMQEWNSGWQAFEVYPCRKAPRVGTRLQILHLRHTMGCLLGPVVQAWPGCLAQVQALSRSGKLQERAAAFVHSRGGFTAHPAEMLAGLLGPAAGPARPARSRPAGDTPQ